MLSSVEFDYFSHHPGPDEVIVYSDHVNIADDPTIPAAPRLLPNAICMQPLDLSPNPAPSPCLEDITPSVRADLER